MIDEQAVRGNLRSMTHDSTLAPFFHACARDALALLDAKDAEVEAAMEELKREVVETINEAKQAPLLPELALFCAFAAQRIGKLSRRSLRERRINCKLLEGCDACLSQCG